jgi:glutamine amidotransferase
MPDLKPVKIAIVDYGMGNLYSVKHACMQVGLPAIITSSKKEILDADVVILPGVGAFGDAMETLQDLDLVSVLRDIAASPKLLVGICLGVQLLMSESYEFGRHKGLGIIEGSVVRFHNPIEDTRGLKVPHVGWNRIHKVVPSSSVKSDTWADTLLEGLADGEYMYFVHSFTVRPQDVSIILSVSRYGHIEFCSSLQYRNVFACQFHPERSGVKGLQIYRNLARRLRHAEQ